VILKVSIEANWKRADFFDVVLDLETGTYKPYRKEPPALAAKDGSTFGKNRICALIDELVATFKNVLRWFSLKYFLMKRKLYRDET